jgi:hypothetical protein
MTAEETLRVVGVSLTALGHFDPLDEADIEELAATLKHLCCLSLSDAIPVQDTISFDAHAPGAHSYFLTFEQLAEVARASAALLGYRLQPLIDDGFDPIEAHERSFIADADDQLSDEEVEIWESMERERRSANDASAPE